ncbi:MAG TPA: hypothetical protein VGS28_03230 [Candidatus Saccharimonadales bacterium]|nr:hypothetical protein [Candidatus Saccharimonadales bacterium]
MSERHLRIVGEQDGEVDLQERQPRDSTWTSIAGLVRAVVGGPRLVGEASPSDRWRGTGGTGNYDQTIAVIAGREADPSPLARRLRIVDEL